MVLILLVRLLIWSSHLNLLLSVRMALPMIVTVILLVVILVIVFLNKGVMMIDSYDKNTQQLPQLPELSVELFELYARLVKLQKQRVRISAEIDNVRELIRQKG